MEGHRLSLGAGTYTTTFGEERLAMEPVLHRLPLQDKRQQPDRRARPTTLGSTLRWQGRRTDFRRTSEGDRAYVDCVAGHIAGLAVLVTVASLLDALLTLLHIQEGGSEANPLMALALATGPTGFVLLKLSLTGVSVWVLAVHQQWPLAVRGLRGLALGYGLVLAYHCGLSWHVL